MSDVALTPKGFNLFSCTKMQKRGWKLGGDASSIWLTKDGHKISFDIPIHTPKGVIFAAYIRREVGVAGVTMGGNSKEDIPYKEVHDIFGHIGEEAVRRSARYLG